MNADKAKEHFSAYYEGTLDRGLRQSLERRLESDAALKTEYRAFERTMKQLDELSAPVPEPDFDLHERISARLDRQVFEAKAKSRNSFFGRWRTVVVGGACALVLVGAGLQIATSSNVHEGGIFSFLFSRPAPEAQVGDRVSVTVRNGQPTLQVVTGGKKIVTVKLDSTGEVLRREELDGTGLPAGAKLRSVLTYNATQPTLLRVEVQGSDSSWLVALPGSGNPTAAPGRGSIREFALALAARYHVVVVVAKDRRTPITWDFKDDPVATAAEALKGTDCSVDKRTTDVVWIQ